MKQRLSKRQQQVLDYIRKCAAEGNDKMPSLGQLAAGLNITPATMVYHMRKLREKGMLGFVPASRLLPRSELTACSRETCPRRIKVLRSPMLPPEKEDSYVIVPDKALDYCDPAEVIACEMPDDSMFEIGIHNGDIMIGIPTKYIVPQAGDIVIAELQNGELLVRSIRPFSKLRADLLPANKNFAACQLSLKKCQKLAVVISAIRNF